MNSRRIVYGCIAVAAAVALSLHAQTAGNGRLMKLTVTTTMQMQGMSIPAHNTMHEVCVAPGPFDPRRLANADKGSDCAISNYRQNGKTITYHVACTRPQPVSSDGTFHQRGGGDFDGDMHTTMSVAGHEATVDTHYVGTQVGACSYTPSKH